MQSKDLISLTCGVLAVLVAGYILTMFPATRTVESLGTFIFKLLPFFLAATAISLANPNWFRFRAARYGGISACFLVIFCLFVPKIFFYLDDFEKVYYTILVMIPFLILTLTLVYRIGGATSGSSLKLALVLLVLMLSGLEDLAFLTVNDHTDPAWATIPEVWTWASHMAVRLGGHYPTKYQAYAFITAHVAFALALVFIPWKILFTKLGVKSEIWDH